MNKNFISNLPPCFVQNTLDLCGEIGEQWLKGLPRTIEEVAENWLVEVNKPFQNLSYNYVAPCVCADGSEAVLKIALPLNNPEIFNEASFLQIADGKCAVKFLNFDEKRHAMLLEKLTPGANLKEICSKDDAKAVEIAIGVMRGLLKNPPENSTFQRLEDWFNGLKKAGNTKFDRRIAVKAFNFFEESTFPAKQKFLLHGDLHHENILSAQREPCLAIDPKGIIGDIGYEIAVFLNNHLVWLSAEENLQEKLDDAVRRFSEAFEITPQDLKDWAFAQMVLSAWWTFEENGENWQSDLRLAETWEA
jgi:streptomycin 6-kinase